MGGEGGPSKKDMGLKPEETQVGQDVLSRLKARVAENEKRNPRKKPAAGDLVGPLYWGEDFKAYVEAANKRLDELRNRDWNLDKKFRGSPDDEAARLATEEVDRLTRANHASFLQTHIYPDDTQVEEAYRKALELYEKLK